MVQRNTGLAGRTEEAETAAEGSPARDRYRALGLKLSNLAIACKLANRKIWPQKAEFSDFFYFLEARAAPLSEVEKISDKEGITQYRPCQLSEPRVLG